MTRLEFLKICGILGVSIPLQPLLSSCSSSDTIASFIDSDESVLIIGAGAAGMSAAYLLKQRGVDFTILEASSSYGGRVKTDKSFTDFPIPLGGEWLHGPHSILDQVVNNSTTQLNTNTIGYTSSDTYWFYNNGSISKTQLGSNVGSDRKFINATWLTFYEDYILPSISDKMVFNTVINSIDYSGDQVTVTSVGGQTYTADRVIVTVPLKILQENSIAFSPALPSSKIAAINNAKVWPGLKVFFEFSEKFYPTFLDFSITPETSGQKLFYDAAYGQNTNKHILALFCVGTPSEQYTSLSGDALKTVLLNELDSYFDNKASASYVKHIVQNWNNEPFAKGTYLNDHENYRIPAEISKSVNNKIYFAGEAYTDGEDWGSVHAAAASAKRAVEELVG